MKKTYGQKVIEHQQKNLQLEDDIIEYRKPIERDLLAEIFKTVDNAKNLDIYKNKDFFIVVLMKVERIGQAYRNFVFARRSCPTPVYKQAVWKYRHASGDLQFLWSIPDGILYNHIIAHQEKYLADKECRQLAQFCILMESGDLLDWVKRENGEKVDCIIKINKEEECQTN